MVHNLVTNAVEAMQHKGQIKVSADNVVLNDRHGLSLGNGNYVKIRIKDQGHGISRCDMEKVFDPFFTTKDKGRGLGLSLAHSTVKKHGGQIVINSAPGQGTNELVKALDKVLKRKQVAFVK